ncbi:unnamed protein product [Allacma fusca]|uniref:Amidase domain-containing protein n=1 Tax=Allacma fusca TaxID=39272 RepID=A0A8J2LPH1_9HEXA|nr:unnamed protein product [Allacma fusca]
MSENIKFKLQEHVPKIILGGLGLIFGVTYLKGKLIECKERGHLNNLRAKKQKEREEKLFALEKKYPSGPESATIVSLPFEVLVSKLQKRELSAQQVLEAYVAKAIAVTRDFNCVTEFVRACFDQAKDLDSLKSPKGPLHGIPICIKEDHDVDGMDTTLDCAGYTGVTGIMASEATTLSAVYRVAVTDATQNEYDPLTVPIPWNAQIFESKRPLRIGYYTSLPVFPAMGDTPDTVLKAKTALEALGHTVVPFEMPDPWRMVSVFATLATADGGNMIYKKLKYDEISRAAEKFKLGRSLLSSLRLKLSSLFIKKLPFSGDPTAQRSEVLWEYLYEQRKIKYEMIDKMKIQKLDLILAPVFPFPATRIEDSDKFFGGVCYTCIYNLLDFPAGVIPFGIETCSKIEPLDDQDDYFLKLAKEGIKSAKGMPIGVQVIGKPFKEEMMMDRTNKKEHEPHDGYQYLEVTVRHGITPNVVFSTVQFSNKV